MDVTPGGNFDLMAQRIFATAIIEHRCGEVLQCFFDGGSVTVDGEGKLVFASAEILEQMGRA